MEPAGLAHLFVAFALLGVTAVYRGRPRIGMTMIGVSTMGAVLTKINIGLFLACGVAYAVIVCWPSARCVLARRIVAGVALLAIPLLVMAQIIAQPWVQRYVLIEVFALVGLVALVVSGRGPVRPVPIIGVLWGVGAAAATAALAALGVLTNGTSLGEFVSGGLLSQRGLARLATIPLPTTSVDVALAGVAAALALFVALTRYVPGAAVRIALGCWLSISVVGSLADGHLNVPEFPSQAYVLAAPLAWVVLTPRSRRGSALSFERIAISTAGVLGFMEAFPGAGSQRSWACLLLVPVALLCLFDGMEMLSDRVQHRYTDPAERLVFSVLAWVAVVLVVLVPVGAPAVEASANDRGTYDSQVPLDLPGAETLRLPSYQVVALRAVTAALEKRCTAFESLPGMNSFYFFTGEQPPTGFNTTQWYKLLDRQEQDAAVLSLERTTRPCVLANEALVRFWAGTGKGPGLNHIPLTGFMRADLVPLDDFSGYTLYVKRPSGAARS
jgi:hypothetical protein